MALNEILLITGGNTGLGFETVKSLCQSSKAYTILLGGRSLDKANAAAESVRADFPQSASTVKAIQVDIEDDDSISKAYEQVDKEYGHVDILINNAGRLIVVSCRSIHALTGFIRHPSRSTSYEREDDHEAGLEQILGCQYYRDTDHDLHICAFAAEVGKSQDRLHRQRNLDADRTREGDPMGGSVCTKRLAQAAHGARSWRIPIQ